MRRVAVVTMAVFLALAIGPMVMNQVASAKPSKHEQVPTNEGLPDEFPEKALRLEIPAVDPTLLAHTPAGRARIHVEGGAIVLWPGSGDAQASLVREWTIRRRQGV